LSVHWRRENLLRQDTLDIHQLIIATTDIGNKEDSPVDKFWRDAKLCTIGEGTSEIQRLVIARELLGG